MSRRATWHRGSTERERLAAGAPPCRSRSVRCPHGVPCLLDAVPWALPDVSTITQTCPAEDDRRGRGALWLRPRRCGGQARPQPQVSTMPCIRTPPGRRHGHPLAIGGDLCRSGSEVARAEDSVRHRSLHGARSRVGTPMVRAHRRCRVGAAVVASARRDGSGASGEGSLPARGTGSGRCSARRRCAHVRFHGRECHRPGPPHPVVRRLGDVGGYYWVEGGNRSRTGR
jgi:hypothetical protein